MYKSESKKRKRKKALIIQGYDNDIEKMVFCYKTLLLTFTRIKNCMGNTQL